MGRPIKKSKMAGTASGAAGQIAVTAYRPSGASKVDSTTAYIISQRGSKLFKISLEDSSTGVYCLKAVAPGSLTATPPNGSAGEFCVQVILDDSTVAYVEKFFNNTIHYVEADGTTGTIIYQLNTEGTDEAKVSGVGNIDVITDQ
jgi:hypothetical protein|tara:strand:- start:225 stop:659 length:435 start_codon:yes stop_codon:yes gene_type:complete